MADPPRPRTQPPPLPPSLRPAPEEPFLDLTDEQPDTVRTRRDEETPPPLPLTEATARALRRDLLLLRETLPTLPSAPPPVTLAPPSKARQAGNLVVGVGKYAAVVAGVLGLAVQVATIWRPDLVGPLQMLQRLLGGP
jgi:hypothetical protein